MQVVLAARNVQKLATLCRNKEVTAYRCDTIHRSDVESFFSEVGINFGYPDVAIYNAASRVRGLIMKWKQNKFFMLYQ